MRDMKASGNYFIEQIPIGWNVRKIGNVAAFINGDRGANYPSGDDMVNEGIHFITSNNIGEYELHFDEKNSKYITRDRYNLLGGAKIRKNDIVFCLRGSIGKCSINTTIDEGTIASSLVVIRSKNVNPVYLYFYLNSNMVAKQTEYYMNGTCAANLSAENVSKYCFIEPPYSEQAIISDYLNSKCSKIDSVISTQETIIEKLKEYKLSIITEAVTKGLNPNAEMKDSGVPWIGLIPSHWEMVYAKQLFTQRKDRAYESDEQLTASQEHGIISQTRFMELEGRQVVQVLKGEDILKHVETGDFVISMRSFQGGLEYSEITGKISSAYVMLIPNKDFVYDRYYKWLFKSNRYITALQGTSNLIRDGQALRFSNFVQVYLPKFDKAEQKRIADYLDDICPRIDKEIEKRKLEIEKIKEYKHSLIYEVVTGKKEVCSL